MLRTAHDACRIVRDMALLAAASAAIVVLPPASLAAELYHIEWWSLVKISRFVGNEQETVRGERRGRGRLVYEPLSNGRRYIRFESPEGGGEGVLGPTAPEWLVFPTAFPAGAPPPPPHLTTGTVSYVGDPAHPELIEITFVEGFICRATPPACDGVASWSREFAATVTPAAPPDGAASGR